MNKTALVICLFLLVPICARGENYQVQGRQESQILYKMSQNIEPGAGTKSLKLSYVVPDSFSSPSYDQKISGRQFLFDPHPSRQLEKKDLRGNRIINAFWENVPQRVKAVISFEALNNVRLDVLNTSAPFPAEKFPDKVQIYLESTEQVPADNQSIRARALELTAACRTQFDAVQKILVWIINHMDYVLVPDSYSAVYSFNTGKGNCQNFSHLAAAMMRSAGIPVRIVNGIALKKPYDLKIGTSILTMKMAQGRHSWIEVFFPDLSWVPFDPQNTEMFVSNRYIRVEIGVDNNETKNDGLIQWTQAKGVSDPPQFEERIEATFNRDNIDITAVKMNYGPREMLLCPRVEVEFSMVSPPPSPPMPQKIPDKKLKQLEYTKPVTFGNLSFPEHVDFMSSRGAAQKTGEGMMEMRKNFIVETAQYVTTRGRQYAQIFVLNVPIKLDHIGIPLHMFNERGQLWLELFEDKAGNPGSRIAASDIVQVGRSSYFPGYKWVDFTFDKPEIMLSPGRYWFALGFTDGPIVNWFYTYGKPVGPIDGTRYKEMFDETWRRSMAFEFNYRVSGLTVR